VRGWPVLLLLVVFLFLPGFAHSGEDCSAPDVRGVRECGVALPDPLVARMLQAQERPRWCWAAAISIVFARYGYAVTQSDIVERMYGLSADLGMPTHFLPAVIEREWVSEGLALKASTHYQVAAPGHTVPASATLLISSLQAGHPLILSSNGHAVVVVGIRYERQGHALRFIGGTVIDPLPGVGLRPLQAEELGVALLARVDIAPVPERDKIPLAAVAQTALAR
jgi:hypothetical protein